MASIPRLSGMLRRLFVVEAARLAQEAGVIQRQRVFSAASLLQLLVFGWLKNPHGGPSFLARFAGSLDLRVSKQAIEERFTMATAEWVLAVLRRGVQFLVCAQAVSLPLLQRFSAVLLEDGSTIALPAALKEIWQGCGGSGAVAALKLTVRWDLLTGALAGPCLQDGRQSETRSPLREQSMARGSLWIGDVGYFALTWLSQLAKQGVYFLLGYKEPVTVWTEAGKQVDVLALVPPAEQETLDVPVCLGASKQVPARLIGRKMPKEVVQRRRERLQEAAHKQSKAISPRQWELAQWMIVLTNVPLSLLSAEEALALLRARWQVELLWKLWKDLGQIDTWQTANPARILCELYAKLLGMLVQHWLLLLSCWDDPHRSLVGAAQVIRDQVPTLVHGLTGHLPLGKALRLITNALRGGCSIPRRQTRLSTSYRLVETSGGIVT
ncbi:MAG TPA: IS4 family transposase [Ktedonobacteraceae bacterium]|nr:IS4 family transposase [Ktedonobacteraceae bacterium]